MRESTYDIRLISCSLCHDVLFILGHLSTKNNIITAGCCSVPMEHSKYEAKHYIVIIDSDHVIFFTH